MNDGARAERETVIVRQPAGPDLRCKVCERVVRQGY